MTFYTYSTNNCIYTEAFDKKTKLMYLFRYFANSERISLRKIVKFNKIDFSKPRVENNVPEYIQNKMRNYIIAHY